MPAQPPRTPCFVASIVPAGQPTTTHPSISHPSPRFSFPPPCASAFRRPQVAERTITDDLEYLIEKVVDPATADYAVITGVQIHNWGKELSDNGDASIEFVAPAKAYTVVNGLTTYIDLPQVAGARLGTDLLARKAPLAFDSAWHCCGSNCSFVTLPMGFSLQRQPRTCRVPSQNVLF